MCSSGCPGTHFVDQGGLELRNPPASASQVLGLKACGPAFFFFFFFELFYSHFGGSYFVLKENISHLIDTLAIWGVCQGVGEGGRFHESVKKHNIPKKNPP